MDVWGGEGSACGAGDGSLDIVDGGGVEGRGVEGREPRLWEELRKTTVSSPGGVAPLVGRQVPSIEGQGHSLATKRHKSMGKSTLGAGEK
jgi:hypothetical protein